MASAVLMAVRAMAAAIAVVLMLVLTVMMGAGGQDAIPSKVPSKNACTAASISPEAPETTWMP